MPTRRRATVLLLTVAVAAGAAPDSLVARTAPAGASSPTPGAPNTPSTAGTAAIPDPYAVVHGMTISCHGSGRVWGTDAMVDAMRDLKAMGVNWVTIHPYAGISGDGRVGSGRMDRMYGDTTWLTRPIREAHALGLKIMIKPHIAYWGSEFPWRGAITFQDPEAWQRFFATYEDWITMVAGVTADADAFTVGTELGGTTQFEAQWRHIIAKVREKTSVPLTYAANWDRYERVGFWDALDVIGIQGYFPLVDHPGVPTRAELDDAWSRLVRRLEGYAAQHGRKVVLAELGYNRSVNAALEPWDEHQVGDDGELVQRRCMTAALEALARSDTVSGAFLWKWFPEDDHRRRRRGGGDGWHHGNFIMMTPAMRGVIAAEWGGGAAQ